jgi:hypothetical protein
MSEEAPEEDWFEAVWTHREETVYPGHFGSKSGGIYTVPWSRLEKANLSDPRWSTCGVLVFPPAGRRKSWLYVTSGLSNAWFDDKPNPDGPSGFGCEFVMEAEEEVKWPIHRLHQLMVYQIGIHLGRHGDHPPLDIFQTAPLGSAVDWEEGELTYIILGPPVGFADTFTLPSGTVKLLSAAAITGQEREYAIANGSQALLEKLKAQDAYPVTKPTRMPVSLE